MYYCRSGSRESVYFISCLLATFVSVAGNRYISYIIARLRLIASWYVLLLLTLWSPTQVYTTTYRRQVYTCSKEQHAHHKNAYVLYTRALFPITGNYALHGHVRRVVFSSPGICCHYYIHRLLNVAQYWHGTDIPTVEPVLYTNSRRELYDSACRFSMYQKNDALWNLLHVEWTTKLGNSACTQTWHAIVLSSSKGWSH